MSIPESTMQRTTPVPSPCTESSPVRSLYSSSQVSSADAGPPILTSSTSAQTQRSTTATLRSTMTVADAPITRPRASLLSPLSSSSLNSGTGTPSECSVSKASATSETSSSFHQSRSTMLCPHSGACIP